MMRPAADLPRVYLCRAPVDFRKGMRSLAVLVERALWQDPFAATLYAFTNRRRDAVKCLYWERKGFHTTQPCRPPCCRETVKVGYRYRATNTPKDLRK
jgi:transposase